MKHLTAPYSPVLALGAGILSMLLLGGCQKGDGDDSEAKEEAPPIPVEVAPVTRGEIYAVYSGTAPLEAEAEADVRAKVAGEVRSILVEEGDLVKEGQVLALLDGDRLRLELQRTRVNLAKLERDYERNSALQAKGLLSAESVDQLRFDLDAQRAQLELAELELSYTQLRAPIAGVISERTIKIGKTLSPNDVTFRIKDLDPLLAYLHVPERQFNKLQPGQSVRIRIDALGGAEYPGEILRISPVIDPGTGTFKVTIQATHEGTQLKPGMFGRINIVYERRLDTILVPRVALVTDEDEPVVYVVDGDVVERRTVSTGLVNGSVIEVTDGLEGDEFVVVIGQTGLRDGGKVQIVSGTPDISALPVADRSSEG